MDLIFVIVYFSVGILVLSAWWKIFQKTGNSGWLSLLLFVPLVNIGTVFYLAYSAWPSLQAVQKRHKKQNLVLDKQERMPCCYCNEPILCAASFCRYCHSGLPKNWSEGTLLACPYCAEEIPSFRLDCPFCENVLENEWASRLKIMEGNEPEKEPELLKNADTEPVTFPYGPVFSFLLFVIVLVALIIYVSKPN